MYCCLVELGCSEDNLSECEIDRLRETVKEQLNPTDKFTAIIAVWMSLLRTTQGKAKPGKAKDKFSRIGRASKKARAVHPVTLVNCGFAEIKDDDLLGAIDVSKQMLARTTEEHPISGMYYYKFPEI